MEGERLCLVLGTGPAFRNLLPCLGFVQQDEGDSPLLRSQLPSDPGYICFVSETRGTEEILTSWRRTARVWRRG